MPPGSSTRLRLFVVGDEPHSRRARKNLERILGETPVAGALEIVDVLKDYQAALDETVLIAPTLIVTTADSRITISGDMSDPDKVKAALAAP